MSGPKIAPNNPLAHQRVWLGFDVGSVSLKTVLIDKTGQPIYEDYRRLNGRPFEAALKVLRELQNRHPELTPSAIAVRAAESIG